MQLAVIRPGIPEIFAALQGEGPSAGRPSVFVRLARCNLHCVWCDTPYTWNFEGTDFVHRDDAPAAPAKFDPQAEVVAASTQAAADHVLSFNLRRVVITGGEPMLQQSALIDLIDHLRNADDAFHIEIETNGTIAPVAALAAKIDQYNVSPKLAHSGNADQLRLKSDVLAWYADIPHAYFKFVVAEETDLLEVDELIDRMALTRDRVFLMPEGVRSEVLRARARWLSDAALERGLRYSDRQHIHTHGDARGT